MISNKARSPVFVLVWFYFSADRFQCHTKKLKILNVIRLDLVLPQRRPSCFSCFDYWFGAELQVLVSRRFRAP